MISPTADELCQNLDPETRDLVLDELHFHVSDASSPYLPTVLCNNVFVLNHISEWRWLWQTVWPMPSANRGYIHFSDYLRMDNARRAPPGPLLFLCIVPDERWEDAKEIVTYLGRAMSKVTFALIKYTLVVQNKWDENDRRFSFLAKLKHIIQQNNQVNEPAVSAAAAAAAAEVPLFTWNFVVLNGVIVDDITLAKAGFPPSKIMSRSSAYSKVNLSTVGHMVDNAIFLDNATNAGSNEGKKHQDIQQIQCDMMTARYNVVVSLAHDIAQTVSLSIIDDPRIHALSYNLKYNNDGRIRRGLAVVISVEHGAKPLPSITIDSKAMAQLLRALHFHVICLSEPTSAQLRDVMQWVTTVGRAFDGFCLFYSGHGCNKYVCTKDTSTVDNMFNIQDMLNPFVSPAVSAPTAASITNWSDKPKIFIVHACRENLPIKSEPITLPPDSLLLFSTEEGKTTSAGTIGNSKLDTSPFVCELYAHTCAAKPTDDFTTVVQRVMHAVPRVAQHTPTFVNNLTKHLFLHLNILEEADKETDD